LTKIYKILICGGTGWGRAAPIKRELKRRLRDLKAGRLDAKEIVVIEGKAPGADSIAGEMAKELNIHVCEVGALWDTRYRGAGPQRNSIMLALEPHEVWAFHTDLKKSKGTKDTVTKARKAGIPTKVFSQ
jgi:hypothetical protein